MEGIGNSWGVGDSQGKKFKEMYELELKFPEGWGGGGSYKKSLPWGGMEIV